MRKQRNETHWVLGANRQTAVEVAMLVNQGNKVIAEALKTLTQPPVEPKRRYLDPICGNRAKL
jgi:hypothetical protein